MEPEAVAEMMALCHTVQTATDVLRITASAEVRALADSVVRLGMQRLHAFVAADPENPADPP